jgi:hypothetical protein
MKKILLLTIIISFLSVNINVQAADCSNYKTFSHKWNMCKVGKLPGVSQEGAEVETNSSVENNASKASSAVKGLWNKIRTFGGKNIGEGD